MAAAAPAAVPIGDGERGIAGLKLVPLPGIEARAGYTAGAAGQPLLLSVSFTKAGDERRLLALAAPLRKVPSEARALSVHCSLHVTKGAQPRLALVAFEKDGGAWFRVSPRPLANHEGREVRLPLASFRRAAFAQDEDEDIQWAQVEKLWLCLTVDGPAEGRWGLSRAVLTAEPYRPTGPLKVTDGGPCEWDVGHDRAATAKITTPAEGPAGKPCMRLDYAFPGGRHMYVVPRMTLQEVELEGFKALRFTYKATLPKGIDGLLVMLMERDGTQYCAAPPPPASADWKTVTIPFASFQCGDWSKDENDHLDLNDVGSIAIGIHGTASDTMAKGTIWAADVQFVP